MQTVYILLFRLVITIVIIILVYFFIAFVFSLIPSRPQAVECTEKQPIYFVHDAIHIDIILPKSSVDRDLQQKLKVFKNAKYVAFGWGDKGFYLDTPTWKELKFSTAAKAMLVQSEAVMHISNYKEKREDWKEVMLCKDQIASLNNHIRKSFKRDEQSRFVEIPDAGYGDHDFFYEAHGNYNALYTCNIWVMEGLKKSNVKTAMWSPFAQGVFYHFE